MAFVFCRQLYYFYSLPFLEFLSFQRLLKDVQIPNYMYLDFHNSRNVTPQPLWWGIFCTSPFAFLLDCYGMILGVMKNLAVLILATILFVFKIIHIYVYVSLSLQEI